MTGGNPAGRLIFLRRGGGRFEIAPSALLVIRGYVQDTPEKREAGGVLLGRYIRDADDVIVDQVTEPMVGDRRGRRRFIRAAPRHQAVIDAAWRESSGTRVYLGEWHTHPQAAPTPSPIDWFDWYRKLYVDHYAESLFFIIVGHSAARTWEGGRARLIEQLRGGGSV